MKKSSVDNDDAYPEEFWDNFLSNPAGSYNSEVCRDIYRVAQCASKSMYCSDIAKELSMSETHVELIQCILSGAHYPVSEDCKTWYDREAFTYGTSPRWLFKGGSNERFMEDFREYFRQQWGEEL